MLDYDGGMETDSFLVAPSIGLLVWTIWILAALVCAPLAAAKGRWGLFLCGFFTVGITWLIGASIYAMPGSLWFNKVYGDDKQVRALRLSGWRSSSSA